MNIFRRLCPIISDILEYDDEITMSSTLEHDLDFDSTSLGELMVRIEDEFEVDIDEEAMSEMQTVADIVNYIEDRI